MEQSRTPFFPRKLKGLVPGLLVALPAAAVLTLLFALCLALGIPDGWIPLFAHLAMLLAAVAGGTAAGIKSREQGLLLGGMTGLCLFLLHLLITVLWGSASLSCLTYLAAEGMGGMLGGILGVNLRK